MDWDGPWSPDLIRLMLPVAVEIETKREQVQHRATLWAILRVFSKEGAAKEYSDSLGKVLDAVKQEQLTERGVSEARHSMAAQKLLDALLPAMQRR